MSSEAVTARLRAACQPVARSDTRVPMDPASVTARLRSVSELRELCLRLGQGRLVGHEPEPTR
ncbi:MAG TPA: hypothetical protein VK034_00050 [Enhygromyxa sp.]|nr:hypothetical protein [Enhygromyxa sp.]